MAKAGVMLLDLAPGRVLRGDLDLEEEDHRDRTQLIAALDTLNQRYGKGTVYSGATEGTNKGKMKQEMRTPQCTTRWGRICRVHRHKPFNKFNALVQRLLKIYYPRTPTDSDWAR